jgi:hypothetical protein
VSKQRLKKDTPKAARATSFPPFAAVSERERP